MYKRQVMPVFTYVCKSCDAEFDAVQLFYDAELKMCGDYCKLDNFKSGNVIGEGRVVRKNSKRVKLKVKDENSTNN